MNLRTQNDKLFTESLIFNKSNHILQVIIERTRAISKYQATAPTKRLKFLSSAIDKYH